MASGARNGLVLIGVLKLLKGLGLLILGVGALSLQHPAESLRHAIELLRVDTHAHLVEELLAKVAGVDHSVMRELGVGTLAYATVFGTEGLGLLYEKTWAEYMTTGVTVSFLPIEAYEMFTHPSVVKAIVLLLNVAIVVYLVFEIRRRRERAHGNARAPSARSQS